MANKHKITEEEYKKYKTNFLAFSNIKAGEHGTKLYAKGEKFVYDRESIDEILAENPKGNLIIEHGAEDDGQLVQIISVSGGKTKSQKGSCC